MISESVLSKKLLYNITTKILGFFLQEIVVHLLENGANIDMKNSYKQTPLFSAIEGLHKEVAHVSVINSIYYAASSC